MSNPNPFRNAFKASDAHIFEAQIGEHMRKAARREGHHPNPVRVTTRSRMLDILMRGDPMTLDDIAKLIPGAAIGTIGDELRRLNHMGVIKRVGVGANNVGIWRVVI
jgi:hypothetical protein